MISDTHGLLRPEAVDALEGSDLIVHAGDVGSAEVLEALSALAPVHAVRGNNDRGDWAERLPESAEIEVGGAWLYVLHGDRELELDPGAAGFAAVIRGHSHQPHLEECDGVIFLNPGSAGPRRFKLPVSLARLVVRNGAVRAELVTLPV